jgi:hypothetical protein
MMVLRRRPLGSEPFPRPPGGVLRTRIRPRPGSRGGRGLARLFTGEPKAEMAMRRKHRLPASTRARRPRTKGDWRRYPSRRPLKFGDPMHEQGIPQVTNAELIADLKAILQELRPRLDNYAEMAGETVAADEGFYLAAQLQATLRDASEHAARIRAQLATGFGL